MDAVLRIDGHEYELPALNSLTMGEWRDIHKVYGLTPDELVLGLRELADGKLNPGALLTLFYVAIRRARTDATPAEVTRRLDELKMDEVIGLYRDMSADEDEGEKDPTTSATSDEHARSIATSDESSAPFPANGTLGDTGSLASAIGADSGRAT